MVYLFRIWSLFVFFIFFTRLLTHSSCLYAWTLDNDNFHCQDDLILPDKRFHLSCHIVLVRVQCVDKLFTFLDLILECIYLPNGSGDGDMTPPCIITSYLWTATHLRSRCRHIVSVAISLLCACKWSIGNIHFDFRSKQKSDIVTKHWNKYELLLDLVLRLAATVNAQTSLYDKLNATQWLPRSKKKTFECVWNIWQELFAINIWEIAAAAVCVQ